MDRTDRIYVAGGETLIGKALLRQLKENGYANVIDGSAQTDLTDGPEVDATFAATKPEYVFLAAGKSGGIGANQKYPADLMLDNLLIQCQIIRAAHRHGSRKLLYVASSCSYPRFCAQPMQVDSLMTGPLEPTSEAYATAKLAGIKLCQAYRQQYGIDMISAIPGDVFGPDDDFDLENAHVIAALMRRMHQAKMAGEPSVEVWGSGSPRREFIAADDVADAAIFLLQHYTGPAPINVGSGFEVTIQSLAELLKEIVGFCGKLRFDRTKPDGMALKALDSSALRALGWRPKTSLRAGLEETYRWFVDHSQAHA
ncbi:MAG TPA: GDP-L-fucose synthase [Candidatus Binatia bacterium]|nr:GDP-L-fucose synthase [Candidatus Binatia bacterium]